MGDTGEEVARLMDEDTYVVKVKYKELNLQNHPFDTWPDAQRFVTQTIQKGDYENDNGVVMHLKYVTIERKE